MDQLFPGVWKQGRKVLTRNLVPGFRSFSEDFVKAEGKQYRVWDPNRSKPCAALMKGLKTFPIKEGGKVLYLGIASGQTSTYFSDIIGSEGVIYGVEISERSIRDLNPVAEKRGNIVPILADARKPQDYSWVEKVDVVYQDVAIPDQPEIVIRNAEAFLNPRGFAIIAIKSRSIDVTKDPEQVYEEVEKKLKIKFRVVEKVRLDPYEKDHMLFVLKFKAA